MDAFKPLIAKVATGSSLTEVEAKAAFDLIFAGGVAPAQLGGFLMALRARGETIAEITGAAAALRARMLRVAAPPGAIDIVGTGGDGHGTRNISTLAALIAAACGVPVAKHGNRATSSKSGASDVLSALGVGLELAAWEIEACIKEAGIGFMAARGAHSAERPVRPGPGRTRHAHHFQSHRPARQSGRRQIPRAGRLCPRLARTSRAGAAQSWLQESVARALPPPARRGNDHRPHLRHRA